VLLRLLELPMALFDRDGTTSLIVFDEIQDVLAVPGADGKIRSVIQHQAEAATYAFAGSAPGVMAQLFADPKRPLLDQAVPKHLDPLPPAAVADYVAQRFEQTGREVGAALTPFLEFTRGHPQRSMMLAHYVWQRTRPGSAADEGTWLEALDQAAQDTAPLMRTIWKALTTNERRVARALGVGIGLRRGDRGSGGDQALEHRQGRGEPHRQRRRDPRGCSAAADRSDVRAVAEVPRTDSAERRRR
jgi:hypothetical protein